MVFKEYTGSPDFGPYQGDPEEEAERISNKVQGLRLQRKRWFHKDGKHILVPDSYNETFYFPGGHDELMLDTLRVLFVSRRIGQAYVSATKTEDSPYLQITYSRPVGSDISWTDE